MTVSTTAEMMMVGSLHAGIKNLDRFLGEKGMSFGVNQEERESLERRREIVF